MPIVSTLYTLLFVFCLVLNSEVTDLKACLQKQGVQLHLKVEELKEALGKVSSNINGNYTL